jgi:cyclase
VAIDASIGAAELVELVDGVFAWIQPDGSWWVNNAGAIFSGGEGMVVDTCATSERTLRFLDGLQQATGGAPIRLAVNTHEHGDHTYGNCLLPVSTRLIGHVNMRARLAVDPVIDACPPIWDPVPDWGGVTRRLPDVTTAGDLVCHVGERRVELRHPGHPAHTTGDLVAFLPEEGVLFTGDLVFSGLTPLVVAGSVDGALRALEWMAALEPMYLVPGHGPLVAGAEIDRVLGEHERYYRFVKRCADDGVAAGRTPFEEAREADLGEFGGWADAERLVLNLHREYAERWGHELDLVQAFADAMAWNGGPLATHVCERT